MVGKWVISLRSDGHQVRALLPGTGQVGSCEPLVYTDNSLGMCIVADKGNLGEVVTPLSTILYSI